MSNIFGGSPKVIPEFTGLQINTSVQVLPIPIVYGSPRVSINLIYYNGFQAVLVDEGGKGVLSGGKGNQSVEYFATIILALCEGPMAEIEIIYQDMEVWTPATFPNNGVSYFAGNAGQTPWNYIEKRWPADARPYPYLAYYGFMNAQLDSSATVPQIAVVGKGNLYGTSPLNNSTLTINTGQYDPNGNPLSFIGNINLGDADADPGQVILDFLTNARYGANFPAQYIDTSSLLSSPMAFDPQTGDNSVSTFCQAVGLAWSAVINNAESAGNILERWCRNLMVAIVWNGATLRFIPYWDEFSGANPGYDSDNVIEKKYYSPTVIPLISITIDHVLQSGEKGEDPITFSRKDPWEVYNTVRLQFMDRTNFFNANPVEAKDESLIELYGPRVDNIGSADEFTLQAYANVAVNMILRRNVSIRRNYSWKMGPLWAWLDPMDIVQIPDPCNYNNQILVRITSVTDDEDENISVEAEEYPVGSASLTTIPMSATTPPNQGATNSPPSSVSNVFMFVPTTEMLTATGFAVPQWIFGCSATYDGILDTNWGGATIWVSLDNVSYQRLGVITQPSTIGSLTQNLPSYGGINPDTGDTLLVDLTASDGSLGSATAMTAGFNPTLCCLQDVSGIELLSYKTATLVNPNTYALTGLYRGLYGTSPRFWGNGSAFMYLGAGASYFETPALPQYVGQTFYVKATSFNVFNSAQQDLSDVEAFTFVLVSSSPQPQIPPPGSRPAAQERLLRGGSYSIRVSRHSNQRKF